MTERSPTPQSEPSVISRQESARRFGVLAQAVALAGVVVTTVIITLWVSRDSTQPGIEVLIPAPAPVTFQVAGEVLRPGVYSLDGEPRIGDAIAAAGGLTQDADGRLINLALRVRDGSKVVIPTLGSAANAGEQPGDSASERQAAGGSVSPENVVSGSAVSAGLIDLNTATKDQLIALPGIGDVRAESIINWRTSNLISSTDDLLAISGIGPSTVDSIRDLVIQP